jgi:hypothetical protein
VADGRVIGGRDFEGADPPSEKFEGAGRSLDPALYAFNWLLDQSDVFAYATDSSKISSTDLMLALTRKIRTPANGGGSPVDPAPSLIPAEVSIASATVREEDRAFVDSLYRENEERGGRTLDIESGEVEISENGALLVRRGGPRLPCPSIWQSKDVEWGSSVEIWEIASQRLVGVVCADKGVVYRARDEFRSAGFAFSDSRIVLFGGLPCKEEEGAPFANFYYGARLALYGLPDFSNQQVILSDCNYRILDAEVMSDRKTLAVLAGRLDGGPHLKRNKNAELIMPSGGEPNFVMLLRLDDLSGLRDFVWVDQGPGSRREADFHRV